MSFAKAQNRDSRLIDTISEIFRIQTPPSETLKGINGALAQYLEHDMFICGLGSISEGQVYFFSNHGIPEKHLNNVIDKNGYVNTPVLNLWRQRKTPSFFNSPSSVPGADLGWVRSMNENNIGSLLVAGAPDIMGNLSTYFCFAKKTRTSINWTSTHSNFLEKALPFLHLTLIRYFQERHVHATRQLSAREIQIVSWLHKGKTNTEIASILGISNHTVKHHVENILEKLMVHSRTQAVVQAIEHGLISPTSTVKEI